MPKLLFCALLLCAGAITQAHAETWNFTYTGFRNGNTGEFDAATVLSGTFTGSDNNHDGVIAKNELTRFAVGDFDTAGWCGEWTCTLHQFSYRTTGQLSFYAEEIYSDEVLDQLIWRAGDRFGNEVTFPGAGPFENYWYWTDQTTFAITPPPVPEPSVAAMMIIGLLALLARRHPYVGGWHRLSFNGTDAR